MVQRDSTRTTAPEFTAMLHVVAFVLAPLSIGTFTAPSGTHTGSRAANAPVMRPLEAAKHALFTAQDMGLPVAQPGDTQELGGGSANTYCQANINSFGTPALINFSGSLDLSNTLTPFTLVTVGCPPVPQSFGMYTYGKTPTSLIFEMGFLCISPGPGFGFFTPQPLTATTVVTASIAATPNEFSPMVSAGPGVNWYFQLWYRNPNGAQVAPTLNTSDGLHVVFGP